eukprot:gene15211-biopygen2345
MDGAQGMQQQQNAGDNTAAAAAEVTDAGQQESFKRQVGIGLGGRRRIMRVAEQQEQRPFRVVVDYTSQIMDHLNPARMIQDIMFSQAQSAPAGYALPGVEVVWRCNTPLKPLVLNAQRHLACAHPACCCAQLPPHWLTAPNTQDQTLHLCTMDLGVLQDPELAALLAKGLNHIPVEPCDRDAAVTALMGGAAMPAALMLRGNGWWPDETVDSMIPKLQQSVDNWVDHQLQGRDLPQHQELHPDLLSRLQNARQRFWFCEVDKAASSLCILCPALAATLLQQRLATGTDFSAVMYATEDPVQLVMRHLKSKLDQVAEGVGLSLIPAASGQARLRLPLLRLTYKSHKVPAAWRFITTACGTVLDRLNDTVAAICKLLLEAMAADADSRASQLFSWYGVAANAYTVVDGAQQVVINLPQLIRADFTADVTKCFENIPIDVSDPTGVPAVLTKITSLAFAVHKQRAGVTDPRLAVSTAVGTAAKVQWVNRPGHSQHKVYLTQNQALHLMCIAVSSAYVLNGAGLYRQTRGIPMGAAYSPALCNLYLLWWERAALLRQCQLITQQEFKVQVLGEWLYFFRYIDDLRILNGPNLATWVQQPTNQNDAGSYTWVYPSCLGIDITGQYPAMEGGAAEGANVAVEYLDTETFVGGDGSYSYTIYSKDHKLPFRAVKYFAAASNRPSSIGQAVAVAQALAAELMGMAAHLHLPDEPMEAMVKAVLTEHPDAFTLAQLHEQSPGCVGKFLGDAAQAARQFALPKAASDVGAAVGGSSSDRAQGQGSSSSSNPRGGRVTIDQALEQYTTSNSTLAMYSTFTSRPLKRSWLCLMSKTEADWCRCCAPP